MERDNLSSDFHQSNWSPGHLNCSEWLWKHQTECTAQAQVAWGCAGCSAGCIQKLEYNMCPLDSLDSVISFSERFHTSQIIKLSKLAICFQTWTAFVKFPSQNISLVVTWFFAPTCGAGPKLQDLFPIHVHGRARTGSIPPTSGWCFGTWLDIFHFIYGIYNPSHWWTHIFQRSWNHQIDMANHDCSSLCVFSPSRCGPSTAQWGNRGVSFTEQNFPSHAVVNPI